MPELPDITLYVEALERHILRRRLQSLRVLNPFFLRSAEPPVEAVVGYQVTELRRLGKRIAIGFEHRHWLIMHLMIAGRLRWRGTTAAIPARALATLSFDHGVLVVTEAGTKKRASLHVVRGADALAAHDPGGLEVLDSTLAQFRRALCAENHTLRRALTDPHLFSGIGNAYSDEILHRARLSPLALTSKLNAAQISALHEATVTTLTQWVARLREETQEKFPEKVTAFRDGMAVHGRYGKPCPVCETTVQRIRYASNETNYCPRCQTGGKVLADRAMSRLLKKDWPRTVEELERRRR